MSSPNTMRSAKKSSNDLYNTPIEALEAAWSAGIFDIARTYHDPCNGLGKISSFLIGKGKHCTTADKYDYGTGADLTDFMDSVHCKGAGAIVFNPPFNQTEAFIDHALTLSNKVIMFNRATVLETINRSKKHNDKTWPLKTFYSFANRVTCTEGDKEKPTATSVWYGWFVYEKGYKGNPEIKWLFTK